jgi:hypothetical protein
MHAASQPQQQMRMKNKSIFFKKKPNELVFNQGEKNQIKTRNIPHELVFTSRIPIINMKYVKKKE